MLSEIQKNVHAETVLKILMYLLEKKKITDDEGKEIARITYDFLQAAQSELDIPLLYKKLSQKWPLFKSNEIEEWGKLDKKEESEVIRGVIELVRNGKIDEALRLAKTETEDSI